MLVIGHRGAAGHVAENTLGSMQHALALGVDGVEFDVRGHGDRLIVLHDSTLERTTNGRGDYRNLDFRTLRALRTANDESIPLLEEVLALVGGCALVNVELKDPSAADTMITALERWYENHPDGLARILLSAFDVAATARLAERRGFMRLGVLYENETFDRALARARTLAAHSLHLPLADLEPRRVARAQQAGLQVYVYTVNSPVDIARCHTCGADGVFSDFPDRVRACEGPASAGTRSS